MSTHVIHNSFYEGKTVTLLKFDQGETVIAYGLVPRGMPATCENRTQNEVLLTFTLDTYVVADGYKSEEEFLEGVAVVKNIFCFRLCAEAHAFMGMTFGHQVISDPDGFLSKLVEDNIKHLEPGTYLLYKQPYFQPWMAIAQGDEHIVKTDHGYVVLSTTILKNWLNSLPLGKVYVAAWKRRHPSSNAFMFYFWTYVWIVRQSVVNDVKVIGDLTDLEEIAWEYPAQVKVDFPNCSIKFGERPPLVQEVTRPVDEEHGIPIPQTYSSPEEHVSIPSGYEHFVYV